MKWYPIGIPLISEEISETKMKPASFIIKLSEINPLNIISSIFSVKKIIANESIIVYYRLKK